MDRQLIPPLLITPLTNPTNLSPNQTLSHLTAFLTSLPPSSPSRTQLERLADSLGVELGLIASSEGDRREAERLILRARVRRERRRKREEEVRERERERERLELELELEVEGGYRLGEGDGEGVGEGEEQEGQGQGMEEGAAQFDGEEEMDDRGDVEYGDVDEREEDEDEPDNEKMEDGEE